MWSSRLIFVLAASGSAVGLGNIWKFPYITGENGGGAFVVVYLACIALIGVPIMMAEVMLGRAGRMSPINTMRKLAGASGGARFWPVIGWMGVLAGFLILSYYAVIAGWAVSYVGRLASGTFDGADGAASQAAFDAFLSESVGDPAVADGVHGRHRVHHCARGGAGPGNRRALAHAAIARAAAWCWWATPPPSATSHAARVSCSVSMPASSPSAAC